MNSAKFLFSTLIAAAAMTATAYAEIDSALGTLEWTTAPSTGGNFWGGNYELTFNFTEEVIKTLDADKSYVLAAYWGSNHKNPDSNALLLNYSESEDKWTLQLGRGELTNGGYGSAITSDTTYTFSNSVTFKEAIVAGMTYTLSVTGGDQAMTPTLSWDGSSETLSSYAGNMNGGNVNTTMNYGLLNLYYTPDSDYVWGGGESGNWSDDLWSTGGEATSSLPYEDSHPKVTFASSVVMTATEAVSLSKLTVNEGVTLTLEGGLEKISSLESSGTGTIKGAFSDDWGNKFDIGAGFAGTLNVTGGKFTINTSSIGSGSYVLENGVNFQVTANATVANNISFKGVHEFHTNGQSVLTLSGVVSGESSSVVTKQGGGTLYITGNSNEFAGTLQVAVGTAYVGPGGANSGADANLTNTAHGAKIIIESGASFITHLGGSDKTFNGDIYVKNGATLGNKDGNVSLAGDVHWGVTNSGADVSTPTYSADSSVNYTQHWGKSITFSGKLYGNGTVNLGQSSVEANANYIISGENNPFAGTYSLNADTGKTTTLALKTATAAEAASIHLATAQTSLKLGASAVTIAGLSGSGNVVLDSVGASTLTVNGGGDFAGTFASGVSLKKSGAGTLTLSGTTSLNSLLIDSGSEVDVSGSLELTANEGSDFDGTLNVLAGGTLKLSGHDALVYNNDGLDAGVIKAQGTESKIAKIVVNDRIGESAASLTLSKTVQLNGYTELSSLDGSSFNTLNGTISASGSNNTVSSDFQLRNAFTVDVEESGELLMSGDISNNIWGSNGFTKTGMGVLTLSGDNSYNCKTTVSAGTLVAAHQNALGSGPLKLNGGTFGTSLDEFSVAGAVELGEGTTSTINLGKYTNGAFDTSVVARITIDNEISGAGSLAVVGNIDADDTDKPDDRRQRLTLAGNNSYTGGTTLSGARVEAGSEKAFGEGNLTMNGSVVTIAADSLTIKNLKSEGTTNSTIQLASNRESATLNLISTEDTTFAGSLTSGVNDGSKTLDLVKTGAGTLVLSGSNTLNAVTVSEGALSVGGSIVDSYSSIAVASDAQLTVSQMVKCDEATYYGIFLNTLNLATDSKLVVDLEGVQAAGETITLNIVSATAAINLGASVEGVALATADVPAIEDFVSITGNAHLSDYVKQTWTLSDNTLSLTLAIPEPSLFGLLAGLGALTLVGTRRRKKA